MKFHQILAVVCALFLSQCEHGDFRLSGSLVTPHTVTTFHPDHTEIKVDVSDLIRDREFDNGKARVIPSK